MNRLRYFFQKLLSWLRIRTVVAGLEIGDDIIRLAYFDQKAWQLHAVRLEPGVMEAGRIKDPVKLAAALAALRVESKIVKGNKTKKISVVVSLSSTNLYSQVLSLPVMSGDALVKAVDLNLQMASPGEAGKTYSGWEVVGKDESISRLDVLSAFVDKEVVDDIVKELFTAGFLAMAVEPRSIALTRILREKGSGIDEKKPYLFLGIDNTGIDFLVIRNGLPYFEYNNPWKDIAGNNGEISLEKFEEELAASLRQVINFYSQHWAEPIGAVIIAATALRESIEKTVAATAAFPAVRLTLEMGQSISPEWLVCIGCSLRGAGSKNKEGEISLLGADWESQFQEEQIFQFVRFWQVLMPIVFGILVAVFFGVDAFVGATKSSIESGSQFTLNAAQTSETIALEASSTQFNDLVAMAQAAESSTSETYIFLGTLQSLAATDGITITQLSYPGGSQMISLNGSSPSEDRIIAFKTGVTGLSGFSDITLPLTSVQDNGGTYAFQMTLSYTGP